MRTPCRLALLFLRHNIVHVRVSLVKMFTLDIYSMLLVLQLDLIFMQPPAVVCVNLAKPSRLHINHNICPPSAGIAKTLDSTRFGQPLLKHMDRQFRLIRFHSSSV